MVTHFLMDLEDLKQWRRELLRIAWSMHNLMSMIVTKGNFWKYPFISSLVEQKSELVTFILNGCYGLTSGTALLSSYLLICSSLQETENSHSVCQMIAFPFFTMIWNFLNESKTLSRLFMSEDDDIFRRSRWTR